jgi:negative regulator of sigma E activity
VSFAASRPHDDHRVYGTTDCERQIGDRRAERSRRWKAAFTGTNVAASVSLTVSAVQSYSNVTGVNENFALPSA